jgi:hypothetical protein
MSKKSDEPPTLKDKIITLLNTSHMSGKEIAEFLGCDDSYVSRIKEELKITEPDLSGLTKDELAFVFKVPKHAQQELANKFIESRQKIINAQQKALETLPPSTQQPSTIQQQPQGPMPLTTKLKQDIGDILGLKMLAQTLGVDESALKEYIKTGTGAHTTSSTDPFSVAMDMYKQAMGIQVFRQLPRMISESFTEPEKRESSITIEVVQKMLEAQAKEYELKTLRDTVKELRERGRVPEEVEATLKRLEEDKKNTEKQLEWFKGQLEDKKLVEVVQQQVQPLTAKLTDMHDELTKWKTIAEMVRGKPESTIESELTASFKEVATEKMKEWIEQGFMKKEEVVEPKTGKINWSRVIDRGIDVFGKALEKAQLGVPRERQIIPIPPQAYYPPPQTEQPQTLYQQPPPEMYRPTGFFERLVTPKPEPIPQQVSSMPKEEVISGPKIERGEEDQAASPIETGRRPEEPEAGAGEPTERAAQPSRKQPPRRKAKQMGESRPSDAEGG